uniref:Hermes trasposase DNA-binding domain-containing protein n=1 Tax=Lepisosteus oculatus TaxID=7918 RepID=W5N926_LEPOC
CRACNAILTYNSKRSGTSSLQQHVDFGCSCPAGAASQRQMLVSEYLLKPVTSVPATVKSQLSDKCVEFCFWDIRPFHMVAEKGFIDLAQELINVGASHGHVPSESVLPDPTTISWKCKVIAAMKRQDVVREISRNMSDIILTITCHYITPDFKLKNRLLIMFPHEEAKTGDKIQRELQQQLVSVLGFDAAVMNKFVWVTDQGSNIIAALVPYCHLDCQDHVYNTVFKH